MQVVAWGRASSGQLGLDDEHSDWVRHLASSMPQVSLECRLPGETEPQIAQRVVLVACGSDFTVLCTGRGDVWSCGSNRHGELGYPTLSPYCGKPAPTLINRSVHKLACGARHAAAITTSGVLFMWGDNSSGQLGIGNMRSTDGPVEVQPPSKKATPLPKKTTTVAADDKQTEGSSCFHSTSTVTGEEGSFGKSQHARLALGISLPKIDRNPTAEFSKSYDGGRGSDLPYIPGTFVVPLQPLKPMGWRDVACGRGHTVATLQHTGCRRISVLSWGDGAPGCLGHGDTADVLAPKVLEAVEKHELDVVQVACGAIHSALLTRNHEVHTFGFNGSGRLGFGKSEDAARREALWRLQKVTSVGHVMQKSEFDELRELVRRGDEQERAMGIARAAVDGYLLSADESVLLREEAVRATREAEQALTEEVFRSCEPRLVPRLKDQKVVQLACGVAHTVALTVGGCVYGWGHGAFGQIGLGRRSTSFPVLVNSLSGRGAIWVDCGDYHTIALCSFMGAMRGGEVVCVGMNEELQCAVADGGGQPTGAVLLPVGVPQLPHTFAIAAGGAHSVVVTRLAPVGHDMPSPTRSASMMAEEAWRSSEVSIHGAWGRTVEEGIRLLKRRGREAARVPVRTSPIRSPARDANGTLHRCGAPTEHAVSAGKSVGFGRSVGFASAEEDSDQSPPVALRRGGVRRKSRAARRPNLSDGDSTADDDEDEPRRGGRHRGAVREPFDDASDHNPRGRPRMGPSHAVLSSAMNAAAAAAGLERMPTFTHISNVRRGTGQPLQQVAKVGSKADRKSQPRDRETSDDERSDLSSESRRPITDAARGQVPPGRGSVVALPPLADIVPPERVVRPPGVNRGRRMAAIAPTENDTEAKVHELLNAIFRQKDSAVRADDEHKRGGRDGDGDGKESALPEVPRRMSLRGVASLRNTIVGAGRIGGLKASRSAPLPTRRKVGLPAANLSPTRADDDRTGRPEISLSTASKKGTQSQKDVCPHSIRRPSAWYAPAKGTIDPDSEGDY